MDSETNFPIFVDQVVVKGALLKLLVPFEEQKIRIAFKSIFMSVQKGIPLVNSKSLTVTVENY
jgi:hypothetical protein